MINVTLHMVENWGKKKVEIVWHRAKGWGKGGNVGKGEKWALPPFTFPHAGFPPFPISNLKYALSLI